MDNNTFRIAFHLGRWEISKYAIIALAGIIITLIAIIVQAKRRKYPIRPLEKLALIVFPLAVIGARFWYVIGNWKATVHNFWDIFAIWNGGVAIEGAALFVTLGCVVFFWRSKYKYGISMWKYFDIIGPNVFLLQAIGRWGNFFNQEILGPVSSLSSFPLNILPSFITKHLYLASENINGHINYRQPFFLYESIIDFSLWLILLFFITPVDKKQTHKLKKQIIRMNKLKMLKTIKSSNMSLRRLNKKVKNLENEVRVEKQKNKIRKFKIPVQHGNKAVMWFFFYGFIRMIMEPFRDETDILMLGKLQLSTFISSIFVAIAGVVFSLNEQIIKSKWWRYEVLVK